MIYKINMVLEVKIYHITTFCAKSLGGFWRCGNVENHSKAPKMKKTIYNMKYWNYDKN